MNSIKKGNINSYIYDELSKSNEKCVIQIRNYKSYFKENNIIINISSKRFNNKIELLLEVEYLLDTVYKNTKNLYVSILSIKEFPFLFR